MSIFNYKIHLLNTIDFSCKAFDETRDVSLRFEVKFNINANENLIACITDYKFTQDNDDILYLSLEGIFKVSPETFPSMIKNEELIIPANILQYLATICVGAARGEIHARADILGLNTKNLILPPINLTECIKKDFRSHISIV